MEWSENGAIPGRWRAKEFWPPENPPPEFAAGAATLRLHQYSTACAFSRRRSIFTVNGACLAILAVFPSLCATPGRRIANSAKPGRASSAGWKATPARCNSRFLSELNLSRESSLLDYGGRSSRVTPTSGAKTDFHMAIFSFRSELLSPHCKSSLHWRAVEPSPGMHGTGASSPPLAWRGAEM